MKAEQILSYVRQKGVVLIADGDQIKYEAPSGIISDPVSSVFTQHTSWVNLESQFNAIQHSITAR